MIELSIFDQDFTRKVVAWPVLEEIKTVLLGQDALFTSEVDVTLENVSGLLSPGSGVSSMTVGVDWYGKSLRITRDDERATTVVHEYNFSNYNTVFGLRFNTDGQAVAQEVTPPQVKIDGIRIEIREVGAGTPVGFIWMEMQGTLGTGEPDGVVLARTPKYRAERLTGVLHDTWDYIFPGGFEFDGVSQYTFVVKSDVPIDPAHYMQIGIGPFPTTYSGGTYWRLRTGGWSAVSRSLIFEMIAYDHITLFDGEVKNIEVDPKTQTAKVTAENVFKKPAEALYVGSGTAVNAGAAMLAVARSVLDDDQIDVGSFYRAGDRSRQGGATINYNYTIESTATVMGVLQQMAELTSITVFVQDNKLVAQSFQPYQGAEDGLRGELDDSNVRKWGKYRQATDVFFNRVTVGYTADLSVVRTHTESIRKNKVTRDNELASTDELSAHTITSAIWFGDEYLGRAAHNRATIQLAGGKGIADAQLGYRYPATQAEMGLSRFPVAVIQVNRNLTTEDVALMGLELVAE